MGIIHNCVRLASRSKRRFSLKVFLRPSAKSAVNPQRRRRPLHAKNFFELSCPHKTYTSK